MRDNLNLKSSIKEHEIPFVLPSNWKWFKWGDLIIEYQQGLIRSNRELKDSGVPYLKMYNLDNNGNYSTNNITYTETTQEELLKHKLYKNDFLINIRNSKELVGKTCVIGKLDFDMVFNHMLVRIIHHKGISSIYINALLKTPVMRKFIDRCKKGTTTVIALYQQDLYEIPIPIPDTKTQNSISSFVENISSKIELNNRINAELEALAKTLYDYWFVQFDFPNEKGKPYKTSGGKMVWNEELKREIPLGWAVGNFGEIVNIFDSKRIPLSNVQREKRKGEYPYYGATEIMDYIDDFIFDGDYILLAEDGSVMDEKGYPIVQFIWGKTWVNNHAHVLQSKDINQNEYLFFLAKSISVIQIMTGSIQKKINQDNLLTVKIPMPNGNLINKFAEFANPIRKRRINLIEENQHLSILRDWLLPMLMNGQITVSSEQRAVSN